MEGEEQLLVELSNVPAEPGSGASGERKASFEFPERGNPSNEWRTYPDAVVVLLLEIERTVFRTIGFNTLADRVEK